MKKLFFALSMVLLMAAGCKLSKTANEQNPSGQSKINAGLPAKSLPQSLITKRLTGAEVTHDRTHGTQDVSLDDILTASVNKNTGDNLEVINFSTTNTRSSTTKDYSFRGMSVGDKANFRFTGEHTTLAWADKNTLIISQLYNTNCCDLEYAVYKYNLITNQQTQLLKDLKVVDFQSMTVDRDSAKIYYYNYSVSNTQVTHLISVDINTGRSSIVESAPISNSSVLQWFQWSHAGNAMLYNNVNKHSLDIFYPDTGKNVTLKPYVFNSLPINPWTPDDSKVLIDETVFKIADNTSNKLYKQLNDIGYISGYILWFDNTNLLVPINSLVPTYGINANYLLFDISTNTPTAKVVLTAN